MALTGLEIYKHLPKTNCKKCGFVTCLSFAMALAQKKTALEKCSDISAAAKTALEAAAEPPMAAITIGEGERKLEFGGETVLYRHDKTFIHMPQLAISVKDNLSETELEEKITAIEKIEVERVGKQFKLNIIILENESKEVEKFLKAAQFIRAKYTGNILLKSDNPEALDKVLSETGIKKTVIFSATENNYTKMVEVAKKYEASLAVSSESFEKMLQLTTLIIGTGFKKIMLFPEVKNIRELLSFNTSAWRACLKNNIRNLGFPIVNYAGEDISLAATAICKYGSVIILEGLRIENILPLITLALNIYTDPQKPIMMEPKLYEVGKPGDSSPVIVTTNFSLTFYTVQPEIENSRIPAWLVITDSEGMSVLTAWAADKFNPEVIKKAVEKYSVGDKVAKKKMIIPGYVSVMKGKLEEELSGWEIIVGPKEASGIPKFLKAHI